MESIELVGLVVLTVISGWFFWSVAYMLFYSITGLFYRYKNKLSFNYPSIVILIPAYKEDSVIIESARRAAFRHYPGKSDVVVIADSLQSDTLSTLYKMSLKVIEVDLDNRTKAKALNYAMDKIGDSYDMVIVLDADNHLYEGAMHDMACSFMNGHKAIQGHRCAKNMEGAFAFLDAISEEINNHIYSKGPAALGLSSRLAGSGMAFDYQLFKRLMKTIDAVGGFDKELELKIINEGIAIHYLDSALVLDEKVSGAEMFEKQRTRWISAQYHYMFRTMPNACLALFKGKFDYFYKALQLALPPRLLLPGILLLGSLVFLAFGNILFATIWGSMLFGNVLAYSLAIPKKFWTKQLWDAVLALPQAFFVTLKAVFKLKGANKTFIHTPHTSVNSNNVRV